MEVSDDLEKIKGLGSATASRMRSAGLTTIESLAVTPLRELISKTGLGHETALKISREARRIMNFGFVRATEIWERRKSMVRCTTGSKELDTMFGGGIETQAMTELIGDYGAGKTQICLTLAVTAQLSKEQGGLDGNVIFIDTEGTFSPERVYQIASERELDPVDILNGIVLARAYNSDHQCLLIDHLFEKCPEENVELVVVDSMISHFRGEYVGRESLSERQQLLNLYLHKLIRISEAFNVAVVITNQVQANPAAFWGNPDRPTGGHVMAHACTHRVFLRRSKSNTRMAKIIDSPYLPENSAYYRISEKGIEDIENTDQ
jgi:DNA repair protein RadA